MDSADRIIRESDGSTTDVPLGLRSGTPSSPAPRTAPQDPRAEFTPVTVTRVPTPASWSTETTIVTMRRYLVVGKVREAENILRGSTAQDAVSAYYRGVFDAELGRRVNATAHLKAALADSRVAPYAQGILDVYPFFDTFSDGKPEFLDVLVSRAFLANGEVEIARDKLSYVTTSYAGYPDAWMLLGASELLLNHPDRAEEALRRTIPTSKHDVYYWLGLAAAAQGKHNEAIAFFRQALEKGTTPAFSVREKLADSQFARGEMSAAAESYELALQECSKAGRCPVTELSVRPIWINLEFLKQPERGLVLAERALAAEPTNAMASNLVAWSLIRLMRFDEAETHLANALRLDPTLAPAHLNAGTLAWLQNDFVKARASFVRASQLDAAGAVGAQARKNILTLDPAVVSSSTQP